MLGKCALVWKSMCVCVCVCVYVNLEKLGTLGQSSERLWAGVGIEEHTHAHKQTHMPLLTPLLK